MSDAPSLLIGIDLGTSAVKVLAVTSGGRVLGRGTRSYDIHRVREGWAEQDPSIWWEAVITAVREALGEAARKGGASAAKDVIAVGLSGQVNGVVVLDENGRILRPAIIWLDQRASEEADEINGYSALLMKTAMGRAAPIHAAAKLLWLLRHEPDIMRVAWKVVAPKDLITYRLTGRAVTDVTDAGASLMLDLRRRQWARELLQHVGIPLRLLPDVVESPTVVGTVRKEAADSLGIAEGTPVVAGAGDMAAITAGTGVIAPGLGSIMIGTAGQIALYMAGEPPPARDGIWAMTAPMPGGYFWHGLVMTAGFSLTWLADIVGTRDGAHEDDVVSTLAADAETAPPGSRGLIFLPFLEGAATPETDPQARGGFFGATAVHRRGDFARAVMEGVAYNFRHAIDTFADMGERAVRIRIGGGGSRIRLWAQIMADVLNTDLDLLEEHDASALGAAVIAAVGTGVHSGFGAACAAMVRVRDTLAPDAGRQRIYDEYYSVYRQVYPRVRDLSHALGRLSAGAQSGAGP